MSVHPVNKIIQRSILGQIKKQKGRLYSLDSHCLGHFGHLMGCPKVCIALASFLRITIATTDRTKQILAEVKILWGFSASDPFLAQIMISDQISAKNRCMVFYSNLLPIEMYDATIPQNDCFTE